MSIRELKLEIKYLRIKEIELRSQRMELECRLTELESDPKWNKGDIKIWRAIDRRETKHIKILEAIPERDGWKYKVQYELSNGAEISPNMLAREEDLYNTKEPNKYYAKKKPRVKLKSFEERAKSKSKPTKRKEKTSRSSQEILDLLNSI
tara:strand:+ start:2973 stop:3422 length:450 start_codon:yes stop_codon:yes gene_type:complete